MTGVNFMFEKLRPHIGHNVVCVEYKPRYADEADDPADICIECEDCNRVLVSAEDFDES